MSTTRSGRVAKRAAEDASNSSSAVGSSSSVVSSTSLSQPPIKKVHFEPHLIGPVSTLEEMDIKVLEFQNKKLAQRIEQRMRTEQELRHRIEQLEKRQTQDDAVLNVVNRYWNQLNEDVRLLLQRFDAETADEFENRNENEVTTSFLTQLSTWDKEELDDKLANRVQVSTRAIAKLVHVIECLNQRYAKITMALKDGQCFPAAPEPPPPPPTTATAAAAAVKSDGNNAGDNDENSTSSTSSSSSNASSNSSASSENSGNGKKANTPMETGIDNSGSGDNNNASSGSGNSNNTEIAASTKGQSGKSRLAKVHSPAPVVLGYRVDETLKQVHIEIMQENRALQNLNTALHEKFRAMSLKTKEYQDALTAKETENAELRNQIDELQYDLEKLHCRNDKLENHLAEAIEKLKAYHQIHGDPNKAPTNRPGPGGHVNSAHFEELQKDLEEYRELANNRLIELDKLHTTHRETLKEVEKLKMDIRQLPESVIVETTEYKCLQSQFSVLYNESMQIKTMLDETRLQLQTSKNQHLRQVEMMEGEELFAQKKLRNDMIQMEDVLATIRKEYEALRIEFEQNMAANEQTAPINREMRHLITSLQNHNGQLKGEVQRYKRKYKETSADNVKLRKELEAVYTKYDITATGIYDEIKADSPTSSKEDSSGSTSSAASSGSSESSLSEGKDVFCMDDEVDEELLSRVNLIKQEKDDKKDVPLFAAANASSDAASGVSAAAGTSASANNLPAGASSAVVSSTSGPAGANNGLNVSQSPNAVVKMEKDSKEATRIKEIKVLETNLVRDLKAQLKKSFNDQKEMKLLLDMYKGVSKEQRDKVQLMAAEKKLRSELDEARMHLKKLQESKREERKKLADEEAMRKIKQLEEQKYELQKQVANQPPRDGNWHIGSSLAYGRAFVGSHEEEALLNEMEVTGQAFEDMQEQNSRLIQQLREKDDANFKLMSERIKANQMHKMMREEKKIIEDQIASRDSQIDAMMLALRKLEEKERTLQTTVNTIEKELMLRQQAMEMHKRKAIESAQSAADLKLHLEKYHSQMKEAQQVVAEKTSALEAEAYKTKRLQEELAQFKRKAERMKKIEMTGTTIDEVMMEEIREYKETLTCPSCKVKRKDAVLSKCFHVFCYDCLRTRYETRQRKCPKCNCAFGANDYHRLYLT